MDRLYTVKKGRFTSKYDGFQNLSFRDILKWKLSARGQTKEDDYTLKTLREIEKLHSSKDYISWLGHSTFLIQIGGKRVITDPVFGDIPLHNRRVKVPYTIDELPKIDYIVISHSHYDHLHIESLKALAKFKPKIIVPLGIGRYLKKIKSIEIIELDWFQSIKDGLDITLLPGEEPRRKRRGFLETPDYCPDIK